jgi:predicted membrane channel-forming protein YqfA (hemolysin III family)
MESGWDPEVKIFFLKILNTVSWGLLWLLSCATAGIYFKLAIVGERPLTWVIVFYLLMVITLLLLLRCFYHTWKKP